MLLNAFLFLTCLLSLSDVVARPGFILAASSPACGRKTGASDVSHAHTQSTGLRRQCSIFHPRALRKKQNEVVGFSSSGSEGREPAGRRGFAFGKWFRGLRPKRSKQEPPALKRDFVWVRVQKEGSGPSRSTRVKRTDFDVPFDIDSLKDAVKAKCAPDLDSVSALDLKVFANDQELTLPAFLVVDAPAGDRDTNPLLIKYALKADALLTREAGENVASGGRGGRLSKPRQLFWGLLKAEVESLLGANRQPVAEWQRRYRMSLGAPSTSWQGSEGRELLLDLMQKSSLAIIDGPHQKLGEEPYSFPQDISGVITSNLQQAVARKDLLCVVRGTGTGKTRLLEESRLQLLRDRPADRLRIVLTATFNGDTALTDAEVQGSVGKLETISARTTLALALRVAGGWYNWDFELVKRAAATVLETSDFSKELTDVEVMKQLLALVISDLLLLHETREFEIVLLVDEALRLQKLFERLHPAGEVPQDSHVFSSVFVAFSGLQPSFDTSEVYPKFFDGYQNLILKVNASLGISSLQFVPQFSTNSGRVVTRLPMANRLLVDDIVERWWKVGNLADHMEDGGENVMASARGLAAALSSLPRAVEAVGFKLDEWRRDPRGITASPRDLCVSMWLEAETALVTRYRPAEWNSAILFPALFNRAVSTTDARVAKLIEQSLYVNTPDPALDRMVPEVNIAYVCAAGRYSQSVISRALRDLPKMPGNPFLSVDEGDPLEFALARMLVVRLGVAVGGVSFWNARDSPLKAGSNQPLSWTEVLTGFNDDLLHLGNVVDDEAFALSLVRAMESSLRAFADTTRAISSSRRNLDAFFSSFDKVQEPVYIPRVASGDAFDSLVLLEPPGCAPFAVFYECKAPFDFDMVFNATGSEMKLDYFAQLKAVQAVVDSAKNRTFGQPVNKLLIALRAERWHFVYVTTLSQESTVQVPAEFETHCSVMKTQELQAVLGPAFPLFDAFSRSIRQRQPEWYRLHTGAQGAKVSRFTPQRSRDEDPA